MLRAATAAGRVAFGYNRSAHAVNAAVGDGFEATGDLEATLQRAAHCDALIVIAVPMPALPPLLRQIGQLASDCPLTDVISVKGAVLEHVVDAGLHRRFVGGHPMAGTAYSGWAAGRADLFTDAPWVISVDDHVDPGVFATVLDLILDCGAMAVPAQAHEHDAAVAAISHLPHLVAEALASTAAEVPLAFALAAGSFRDGTRVAGTAPDLVRAMCEANRHQLLPALDTTIAMLSQARQSLRTEASVADLVHRGHAARTRYEAFARTEIRDVVIGVDDWRRELAAAGRSGAVIRSSLPIRDSR